MSTVLATIYILTVAALSLFGFLGLLTLGLYWRHRHDGFPCPPVPRELPSVTVQLPLYNERFVVERLLQAAVSLVYPADRLQIQVVDDSTDDTTQKAAALVDAYRRQGVDICLIHRQNRTGYKAGALANALSQANGDFIAVFDADFQPRPDFLLKTIPHFAARPDLGMIQARWGHLNDGVSPLTAAQAIALDKHFAMEQTVRHRANLFPKFNGAGGVWRRACLEDAGGWHDDTVCEDLCLSIRAILRDWEFLFLNDVVAPAELPTTISAFKNQQARWSKGASQCLLKYGRAILTARQHSLLARGYALLLMSAYGTHLLVLALLLLQIPLLLADFQHPSWMLFFSLAGLGQPLLFMLSQRVLYPNWSRRLRHFPTMVLIAIGLAPNNGRAIMQAFWGRQHPFNRTPKYGSHSPATGYTLSLDRIIFAEIFLAVYALVGIIIAFYQGAWGALFFLSTCLLGFAYVAYLSLRELHWRVLRTTTA